MDNNKTATKPKGQRKCGECSKLLPNNSGYKVWYEHQYQYFCSQNCINNKNVEYLECNVCNLDVRSSSKAIFCDNCFHWTHIKCSKLNETELS